MERKNPVNQELADADRYMNMVPLITAYLKLKYPHIRTIGREHIPDGPAMFVANHLRVDDSLIIAASYAHYMKRPLRLGAKSEYFDGLGINNKGLLGKQMKKFVDTTQQIPVYRSDNVRGAVTLGKELKYRFGIGESVLLHAEGTRSKDGQLNKFQLGAAAFAIKYSVPLIPTSITYPKFGFLTVPKLEFGEPLTPQDYGMEFPHFQLVPDGIINTIAPRIMKQSERIAAVSDIAEQRVALMSGQHRSGMILDPYDKDTTIE
ncbi:1-acyl-sn-glycerol-3-phosphate acyltransferase [Candidatus Saccharibacteria bacterium]|nr:1-acyl-sn-glycerol-3-phosphate acyltransferase [Candidatus Saccharibacteria bacterium]